MGQAKLKNRKRGVTLGMHRLVIIEWLKKDEHRTGTELCKALLAATPDMPVEVIDCSSALEVLEAVEELAHDTRQTGKVPVLQIEAHGYAGQDERGLCGPGQNGAEDLPWDVLAGALRKLNIATGFNLIFIGAACWSDHAIYSVKSDLHAPLPFVVAVGFVEKVWSDRLLSAMVSLHEDLLVKNLSLQEALELAHAKLDAETEALAWFSLPNIIRNAALDAARIIGDPAHNQKYYYHMIGTTAAAGKRPIPPGEFHRNHKTFVPRAIERLVAGLLAYEHVPENRERFGFDGEKLAREAARTRPAVRPTPASA